MIISKLSGLEYGDEFRFFGGGFPRIFKGKTNRGYKFCFKDEDFQGCEFSPEDRLIEFDNLILKPLKFDK